MSSDDADADGASSPRKRGLGTFLTNSMLNMMSTPIMEGDEEETDSDDSDFGVEADKPSDAVVLCEEVINSLREHEHTFKMIFPFYCRLEQFSNREYLGSSMWRKLMYDSKLATRRSNAQLDLAFQAGLRFNPADCAEARLTFPGFLGAFATYIIESLSITHATIAETVQKIMLENAPTMRRLEQVCDTSQLRTTKAAAVLKKERTTVQQIFTHYADHHSRKTRINRDKMFQFARDFDLTPQLIARKDIHDIVATVISDGTYVTFPQFVECIGMVAVMAAAKLSTVKRQSTGAKKLTALFRWIHNSDFFRKVRRASVAWGSARKTLTNEQVTGELSGPRRRISIANRGGGKLDLSKIVRRRRSSINAVARMGKASASPTAQSVDKKPSKTLRYGLCMTAPEDDNPRHRPDPKVSVDPQLLVRLQKAMLKFAGKVKPVFDFYCRITDPSNRGFMTFQNFRRLLRDCEAMDDVINANMVNLQLLTITRNKAKKNLERNHQKKGKTEGLFSSLSAETFGGKLDLEMFLEGLCRVSELIRVGRQRFGDGDLVRRIAPEPFNDVFAKAKKAATTFITQRVVPLSQLNFVDDECADVLDEDDVQEALKLGEPLLERAFAFYANTAGGNVRMAYGQFLSLIREFEIVPSLVSLTDAEHAFYTVCRRNDTDCREKIDVRPVFFHSVGKTRDTSYVTFMPFLELMGRIALVGFSKPFLQQSHPEAPQKITALFHWIRSSGNLRRIEQAEWQRGLTRRGRRMTPQQKRGLKDTSQLALGNRTSPRRSSAAADTDESSPKKQKKKKKRKRPPPPDPMQLRTVLLSSTPGVPPPPPMTEDAQRHFQTLGNFEVVSVGGVQPVAPVSPFNHHAQSPVSRGMPPSATPMFTPIRGGMVRPVSPTRPASGINSPAPGTSEFQAVGTAIGALSDALQGSVSGLESLATPLHGAPDIDTVEKCRADVVHNAHRLQRIAGALYNLVQFPDGAAASTPHGGPAQRHAAFRDVQSPPSTPRVGEELDAPMEAADLATSRRGSPGRPVTFASPPPPPPHNDARMDAVRAVASQLVQELTREVSGQDRSQQAPHHPPPPATPMTQPRSFGTSRYTPTLHAGLVPHHMRTSQASPRAGSVPVRAGGGRHGAGSAFANAPTQGRAAASHGNVRASLSVRTRAATHRGEREFLQRQAAGRRKAETRKWIDDHRVVHTADWSGQPTQVSEFHLTPSRPCRRKNAHRHNNGHEAAHDHDHRHGEYNPNNHLWTRTPLGDPSLARGSDRQLRHAGGYLGYNGTPTDTEAAYNAVRSARGRRRR